MNYANIYTHDIADELPKVPEIITEVGKVFQPDPDQLWEYQRKIGWRKVAQIAEAPEGCRVEKYQALDIDGEACNLTVAHAVNIAEEAAQIEADNAKAAADAEVALLAFKEQSAIETADCLTSRTWLACIKAALPDIKLTRDDLIAEARRQQGL